MADKRPDQLPDATAGVKYVHAVNKDDLTDGPNGTSQRVVVNPDNVSDTFIPLKSGGVLEDSALSEDATNVTSTKPIIAPSITVDVGTIKLGGAISMSVGVEYTYLKDSVSGEVARILAQNVGDTLPRVPVNQSFNPDVVRQALKTDNLINPMFTLTPPDNEQILAFTIEAAAPQDNVIIKAFKSGVEVYKNNVGSIPADVEHQIDLLVGDGVPVDVFASTAYDIEVSSLDGDVTLKGINAGTVPFYEVTYYEFELQDLVTADLPINEETLITGASAATSQEPVALDTPIRIEFGAAQGTGSDPLEIDATGLITCNVTGTYFIQVYVQYGRTTSVGSADLYFAAFVNGIQVGNSSHARLDDDDTLIPSRARSNISLTAGDELEFLFARDSSGINNGGLFNGTPNIVGWEDSVCASIVMSRLVGNAATLQSDGDVVGPGSSQQDELPTYANLTGKEIKASSDVRIVNGTIDRITSGEDLWIKNDITSENIIIGRNNDLTGVPNLSNTTLIVTANGTNQVVMSTTGNNSQGIQFVKTGTLRGSLNNNRDRNSIGLENATGEYIEIRPDKTVVYRSATDAKFGIASSNPMIEFQQANGTVEARIGYNTSIPDSLVISKTASDSHIELATNHIDLNADEVLVNGIPVSTVKAYAYNTTSNTASTTMPGPNEYIRCNFGTSMTAPVTSNGDWVFGASRFQNLGPMFKGVVTFICDIAHSDSVELLYDCRVSINNEAGLVGIWRQLYVPVGKSAHMVVDAYVEVDTNDYVQLNIKQPNGAVNFNPVMQRTTIKIE